MIDPRRWLVLHHTPGARWFVAGGDGAVSLDRARELERSLVRNGCRVLVVNVESLAADLAAGGKTSAASGAGSS